MKNEKFKSTAMKVFTFVLSLIIGYSVFISVGISALAQTKSVSISSMDVCSTGFCVSWNKISGITGYQIQYSTQDDFSSSNATNKWVKSNKTTFAQVSGLENKTTYYVRIRTYTKSESDDTATKTYSAWSSTCSGKLSGTHDWEYVKVVKAATTTHSGKTQYACSICGKTKTETTSTNNLPASEADTTIVEVAGKRMYKMANKVLSYVNKERKNLGLDTLTIDSELTEKAMVRAAECSARGKLSHKRTATEVQVEYAENLAAGQSSAKTVYVAWYNSSGHYSNMIDSDWKSIGIGCFYDGEGYWWVQLFSINSGDGKYITTNKTVSQPVEMYAGPYNLNVTTYYIDDNSCSHYWERTKTITAATKENTGKVKYKCTVCGKTKAVSVAKVKCATLSTKTYTYNGNAKKPTVTVYDTNGNIISSKYYTVTYINRSTGKTVSSMTNVGKYYVKIKFKGNYSGTIKKKVTIKPKKTSFDSKTYYTNPGGTNITLSWTKITSCTTGYQIQYSTSSSFKNATTKTIKSNKTKSTMLTLKNISSSKPYYVRIRTYKTVKINGKSTKIYSSWSNTATVYGWN